MKATAIAAMAARFAPEYAQNTPQPRHSIAPGPFQVTCEFLVANYKTPDWYRDANFDMWDSKYTGWNLHRRITS
jgi:hypothetical protein